MDCRERTIALMTVSSVVNTQNNISFRHVYRLQCQFGTVHQSGPSRRTHGVPGHGFLRDPFTAMHKSPRASHDILSSYHNSLHSHPKASSYPTSIERCSRLQFVYAMSADLKSLESHSSMADNTPNNSPVNLLSLGAFSRLFTWTAFADT